MPQVDQKRTQQIILFRKAWAMLHGRTEIAGFQPKLYKPCRPWREKLQCFNAKSTVWGGVFSVNSIYVLLMPDGRTIFQLYQTGALR
jgi:hypothetical protein